MTVIHALSSPHLGHITSLPSGFVRSLGALLLSSVVGTERRPALRASRDEWNEERERREERRPEIVKRKPDEGSKG